MNLFIDTHESKVFAIALSDGKNTIIVNGTDPSTELIHAIIEAKQEIAKLDAQKLNSQELSEINENNESQNCFTVTKLLDSSFSQDHSANLLHNFKIENIIFARGPGSLTGLRIGSSFALGLALGSKAKIQTLSVWDILLEKYDSNNAHDYANNIEQSFITNDIEIFFYTGTKKWVHKTKTSETILEIDELATLPKPKIWISNNPSKLEHILDMKTNVEYPKIIELMVEQQHLASNSLDLIYHINLFDTCR